MKIFPPNSAAPEEILRWARRVGEAISTTVGSLESSLVNMGDLIRSQEDAARRASYDAQASGTAAQHAQQAAEQVRADLNWDDLLTIVEKRQLLMDYDAILSEQFSLDAQAATSGVSSTAYDAAVTALTSFLTGLGTNYNQDTFSFRDLSRDTPLGNGGGETLRGLLNDVYDTAEALRQAIANDALSNAIQALADAAAAQAAADGKIDSYYQTTAPGTASEGDLWFDTDDGNKIYTYRSGVWVNTQDSGIGAAISAAATAQGTADGKARVYYQAAQPTGLVAGDQGDLWVDTDDNLKVYAWTGSAWILAQDWIYALNVAKQSSNLIKNGNCEDTTASGLDSAGVVNEPANAYAGNYVVKIAGTGAGNVLIQKALFPAAPGDVIYIEAQAKATIVTGKCRIFAQALDASGTSLTGPSSTGVTGTTYQKDTLTFTCPAGTVNVRIYMYVESSVTAGNYGYFDAMYAERKSQAALDAQTTANAAMPTATWTSGGFFASSKFGPNTISADAMTVGPQYQYTSQTGGVGKMVVNTDGSLSRGSANLNPTDNRWFADENHVYVPDSEQVYSARFRDATNDYGIMFNLEGSAFPSSAAKGILIWRTSGNINLYGVSSVGTFSSPSSNAITRPAEERLTVQWSNTLAADNIRLRVWSNSTLVLAYTDAQITSAIGATYSGAKTVNTYTGLLLGNSATKVDQIMHGQNTVLLQDGMIRARMIGAEAVTAAKLAADLAIVNVIRSTNYVAGTSSVAPTGFKLSGTVFTTTYLGGATDSNCQMELGGTANFNGYKVEAVTNKVFPTTTEYTTAGSYTWTCPPGVTEVEILLVGSGGGGASGGGGGGGAGAAIRRRVAVTPGTGYTVVVGAAGVGASNASVAAGGNGNASSFGAYSASGGTGGGTTNGGAGATATISPISATGGAGGTSGLPGGSISAQAEHFELGWAIPGAGGGGNQTSIGLDSGAGGSQEAFTGGVGVGVAVAGRAGGGGGASAVANGGDGGGSLTPSAGVAGTKGSGGGSGGYKTTGPVIAAGGNGGPGYVRVRW